MPRHATQIKLFDTQTSLPSGFVYRPDFLTKEEECDLIGYLEDLPLRHAMDGEGRIARRRVMNFGWSYDFDKGKLIEGSALPAWLTSTARKIAKWLDIPQKCVVEALVTEYPPGSAIGWHRDNESFEHIIGISLSGWCRLRLRPIYSRLHRARSIRDVTSLDIEPRSAYLMQNDARWLFQHSVPAVEGLRYSITFRTLPTQQSITLP
jgi:alkylated DNA repair dioxygenase AlkB